MRGVKLYLVRHGLTDWNLQNRFQGHTDTALNEIGQAEAAALARRLKSETLHTIYSSDLARTTETAAPIALERGQALYLDPRLREINLGIFEGNTWAENETLYPEEARAWHLDRDNAPPNAESLSQFRQRMQAVLTSVHQKHQDQAVLFVTHGGNIRMLLCIGLGLNPKSHYWRFNIGNAALTRVTYYGDSMTIDCINSDWHLYKNGLRIGQDRYAEQ